MSKAIATKTVIRTTLDASHSEYNGKRVGIDLFVDEYNGNYTWKSWALGRFAGLASDTGKRKPLSLGACDEEGDQFTPFTGIPSWEVFDTITEEECYLEMLHLGANLVTEFILNRD